MRQMQIYITNPGPSMPVPMDQVRQSFSDWYDQGAQKDHHARLSCGFLGQADFTGIAGDVATSDRHIYLPARISQLQAGDTQQDPYTLVPLPEELHWHILARFDRD